jgi:Ankyrin repeats (3 copies)
MATLLLYTSSSIMVMTSMIGDHCILSARQHHHGLTSFACNSTVVPALSTVVPALTLHAYGRLLMLACSVDLVRELIDRGANVDGIPDAKTSQHCPHSPLEIATRNGHLDTVRLLLQAGAKPNPPYVHLPILCVAPDIEIMSELIAAGADVNAVEQPLSGQVLLIPSPRYSNPLS